MLELTGCVSVAAGLAGTCHWPHYRSRGSPATGGPGTHQSVSAGAQATTPCTQQVHCVHHSPSSPSCLTPGGGYGLCQPSDLPCEAVTVEAGPRVPGSQLHAATAARTQIVKVIVS